MKSREERGSVKERRKETNTHALFLPMLEAAIEDILLTWAC
jgi:hypothetical protein